MKRFLFKLLLLIILITLVETVMYISNGGDEHFLPLEINQYHAVLARHPDVIYFCDSVNTAIAPDDKNTDTISDMLKKNLPGRSIGTIDHSAYQMKVYHSHLRNLLARGERPQAVVVPINLRSLSTGWYLNPGWQFVKLCLLLDHDSYLFRVFFKPLAVFKAFRLDPISQPEFERMPVMDGDVAVGQIKDFMGERFETHWEKYVKSKLIYNYMYKLTPDHGLVRAMAEMARLANEKHVRIIFYVSPVDVQTGDKYLGPRFRERVQQNVSVMKTSLEKEGIPLLDLSNSLPTSAFNWLPDKSPNEHLNERGRTFVAGQISANIAIEKRTKIANLKP